MENLFQLSFEELKDKPGDEILVTKKSDQNDTISKMVDFFVDEILLDSDVQYCVAGGSIVDYLSKRKIKDFDLFFRSQGDLDLFVRQHNDIFNDSNLVYKTHNAKGYKYGEITYDLIHNYFWPEPKQTIGTFDLTVCCLAIDTEGSFYHHKDFWQDFALKQIKYHCIHTASLTLQRSFKYVAKGFVIKPAEIVKIHNKCVYQGEVEEISGNYTEPLLA